MSFLRDFLKAGGRLPDPRVERNESDGFTAATPLLPSDQAQQIQRQQVAGRGWQTQKLVEEERRLDAVAKRAAGKQMRFAAANPQKFQRGVLDGDGNFVPYAEDGGVDRTPVEEPRVDEGILAQVEQRASLQEHDGLHQPILMTDIERRARDEANPLPKRIEASLTGMELIEASRTHTGVLIAMREKLLNAGADFMRGDYLITEQPNGLGFKAVWERKD